MITKKCPGCNKVLNVNKFKKNSARYDGLQAYCIKCSKIKNRRHYENNKETYIARAIKQKKELIEWYKEYKKTLMCEKCGEDRWYVLDFHHKNSEEKNKAVAILIGNGYKKRALNEIKKCIVLCSNCHREEHYFRKNGFVV